MRTNQFEKQLKKALNEAQVDVDLHFFEEATSTNDLAKLAATNKEKSPALFVAERQTAGRGTYGRTFVSASGGLYISFLIQASTWQFKSSSLATHFAAVAVCAAVYDVLGIQLQLKWVNDLFLGGKKAGGILTETQVDANWLVIGIGLNVSNAFEAFPKELKSVVQTLEVKDPDAQLKASLVAAIGRYLLQDKTYVREEAVRKAYLERLFILNQDVEMTLGKKTFEARVLDVDVDGALVVETEAGEKLALQAGTVKLKIPANQNTTQGQCAKMKKQRATF